MKKIIALLLAAVMITGCFAGCAKDEAPETTAAKTEATEATEVKVVTEATEKPTETTAATEAKADSVTVTDDTGRTITIKKPIERVVMLDTGPFEVMSAFDKLDLVQGTHQGILDNELYASLKDKPQVATWSEVNFEAVAELQPQVVFSSVGSHGVITDQELLSGFDIEDVKLDLRRPELMRDGITTMGEIFDSQEKAAEIVAFYDKWENFVADRVKDIPEEDRVRVYTEYHAGEYKTSVPGTAFYPQIELAGGINIAKDLDVGTSPEVSAEWVSEMNPDYILREASGLGYSAPDDTKAKEVYDEIMSRDGLSMTKAVQDGNVRVISIDIYSRPGYVVGVCYLAKWFYPDLFQDLDPEAVLQEYFQLFHPGHELKGTWFYGE